MHGLSQRELSGMPCHCCRETRTMRSRTMSDGRHKISEDLIDNIEIDEDMMHKDEDVTADSSGGGRYWGAVAGQLAASPWRRTTRLRS